MTGQCRAQGLRAIPGPPPRCPLGRPAHPSVPTAAVPLGSAGAVGLLDRRKASSRAELCPTTPEPQPQPWTWGEQTGFRAPTAAQTSLGLIEGASLLARQLYEPARGKTLSCRDKTDVPSGPKRLPPEQCWQQSPQAGGLKQREFILS